MRGFYPLVLLTLFWNGCAGDLPQLADLDKNIDYSCTPAKEFITAVNYLRDHKELNIPESEVKNISVQVSKGCRGAAARFIETHRLLGKALVEPKQALKLSIETAQASSDTAQAFNLVFRQSFEEDGLDLSTEDAVATARKLSLDFAGDARQASEDFSLLIRYCLSIDELNLPRPTCTELAAELTKLGEKFAAPVGIPFVSAVEFLRDAEEGPALTTGDAVKIAKKLVAVSPYAPLAFEESYRFNVSKKGLAMKRQEATEFAVSIAQNTVGEIR